jgi:P27 family predicted phage terminase small subunit
MEGRTIRVTIPTQLKIIRGNPGKRPIRQDDIQPARTMPKPPGHLSETGLVEWKRMAEILHRLGVLTEVDGVALATYAQLYGRWADAETALNEARASPDAIAFGLLTVTSNGTLVQNPLVGAANKAAADMMRYCVEFGMTPSSRSRIHAKPPEEDRDDPIAAYGV